MVIQRDKRMNEQAGRQTDEWMGRKKDEQMNGMGRQTDG